MADNDNKLAPGLEMTRPTSQLDLERRLEQGFRGEVRDNTKDDVLNPEKVVAPYATDEHDTSAYRGVSPEYMQYANETEKPIEATEGPEFESLKLLSGGVPSVRKTKQPDNTPSVAVGTVGAETLNTFVSGENYSSKLVDAPTEGQIQTNGVGLDMGQVKSDEPKTAVSAPVAPAKATAPKSSTK